MSKIKTFKQPVIDDLSSILILPLTTSIEFYSEEDLHIVTDPWIALEFYNLDQEGNEPDEDLKFPWAAIFASLNKSDAANCLYVRVSGEESHHLYSLESLSQAVDLVRKLRTKYRAALKEIQPSINL